MPSFTFSKATQWARLKTLEGYFWPPGLMFDMPKIMMEENSLLHLFVTRNLFYIICSLKCIYTIHYYNIQ